MAARKLIYHLMVLSPILTLGCIALETRIFAEPWDEDPVVPSVERSITAYIGVLRLTQQDLSIGTPDSERVRAIAELWAEGHRTGELKPLPPRSYEDLPRDGARGQILDARGMVLAQLHSVIRKEIVRGRYDQAADDCLLALEVGETLKYSELYTVGSSTIDQRVSLTQLESVLPHLEKARVEAIRAKLRELRDKQQSLDKLVSLSRQQFVEASNKRRAAPISKEDVYQLGRIDSMLETDASPQVVIHEISSSLVAANGKDMPLYLSTIKMGLQSQELLRERFDSLLGRT